MPECQKNAKKMVMKFSVQMLKYAVLVLFFITYVELGKKMKEKF